MNKPTKGILPCRSPKPAAHLRLLDQDDAHAGLLKVGQTTRDVKQRVAEQLKTASDQELHRSMLDECAERDDGTIFTDHDVRAALVRKNFENPELEWMRCTLKDVKTVLAEVPHRAAVHRHASRDGSGCARSRPRPSQRRMTISIPSGRRTCTPVPRFLWNAKMRFGKTFTTYQLAKKLGG